MSVNKISRLRGHHLICLHFFCGEGYDAEFIKNLKNVISAAEEGVVEVQDGADDICKKCPSLHLNRCTHTAQAEDEILVLDSRARRLLGLSPGQLISWQHTRTLLPRIF